LNRFNGNMDDGPATPAAIRSQGSLWLLNVELSWTSRVLFLSTWRNFVKSDQTRCKKKPERASVRHCLWMRNVCATWRAWRGDKHRKGNQPLILEAWRLKVWSTGDRVCHTVSHLISTSMPVGSWRYKRHLLKPFFALIHAVISSMYSMIQLLRKSLKSPLN
jgi:hypothetical protein